MDFEKSKYQFVARCEFELPDDIDAKEKAKMLQKVLSDLKIAEWQFKLQRLNSNKPPEKVDFC